MRDLRDGGCKLTSYASRCAVLRSPDIVEEEQEGRSKLHWRTFKCIQFGSRRVSLHASFIPTMNAYTANSQRRFYL
jgi:hypothetical protein